MGNPRVLLPVKRLFPALMAVTAIATPGAVCAQSASGATQISATVVKTCDIFAIPLSFGTIPFLFPNVDAQTTITLRCTPGTSYSVAIDDGQNYNGQRRMARTGPGLGAFLTYEIYRNAARTQRWGSSAGQVVTGTAPANGASVSLTAYGRATGFINSGPFQDTVTVTVTF